MTTYGVALVNAAADLLVSLQRHGVERIFANGGTDTAPIVEAYACLQASGHRGPEIVVSTHEHAAISMAHGAYLAEGKPQAVLLHTNVGTANAACGVLNASHARVPILVMAGRTPVYESGVPGSRSAIIHWPQEMYDQASLVREAVKWEYELRGPAQVGPTIARALSVATTQPAGPVYLSLPREVLAAPAEVDPRYAGSVPAPVSAVAPSESAVRALAERLASARMPVIVTPSAGADTRNVSLLADLSERFAIPVVEDWTRFVNVPAGARFHAGYSLADVVAHADALCFIDAEVPWIPNQCEPGPEVFVAHCGPDPVFGSIPSRSHRSDLSIACDIHELLTALTREIARVEPLIPERRWEDAADLCASVRSTSDARPAGDLITKADLNVALAELRAPDDVIFNEYWVRPEIVKSELAGTYFGHPPAGGLGWGIPAAMGFQQSRPEATVIAAVGDGAYVFANPAACHHMMAMHELPVLTVIANNSRWNGVQKAALAEYPSGVAASSAISPFADLSPSPDFEKFAEAAGGLGVRVDVRRDLSAGLQQAFEHVRARRGPALVNVSVTD